MPKVEGDEIIYCALCRGWGRYRDGACPACGGVGKFLAPDKWVYCGLCDGHGMYKNNPCPTCGGKGKIRPRTL